MLMKDIPRQEWRAFCARYGEQHRGWLVTVTEVSRDGAGRRRRGDGGGNLAHVAGDGEAAAPPVPPAEQVRVSDGELRGIRFNESPAGTRIAIATRSANGAAVHSVREPTRVSVEETEDGEHRGCRIEAAGEQTTTIRFRAAARPEAVDGLAAGQM